MRPARATASSRSAGLSLVLLTTLIRRSTAPLFISKALSSMPRPFVVCFEAPLTSLLSMQSPGSCRG